MIINQNTKSLFNCKILTIQKNIIIFKLWKTIKHKFYYQTIDRLLSKIIEIKIKFNRIIKKITTKNLIYQFYKLIQFFYKFILSNHIFIKLTNDSRVK